MTDDLRWRARGGIATRRAVARCLGLAMWLVTAHTQAQDGDPYPDDPGPDDRGPDPMRPDPMRPDPMRPDPMQPDEPPSDDAIPSSDAPVETAHDPYAWSAPDVSASRGGAGLPAGVVATPPETWPDSVPYVAGDYVPPTYRIESSPRWGLVGTGAAVLGTVWAANVITAISLDHAPDESGDPNFRDNYWPLFIPVVGPSIAISTADASGTGAAILVLDSALQAAALGTVIAGFVFPEVEAVRRRSPFWVEPTVSSDDVGAVLTGAF